MPQTDSLAADSATTLGAIQAWLAAHPLLGPVVVVTALLLTGYLADLVAKRMLLAWIRRLTARTRFTWDDVLDEHKVFERLALAVPAAVFYFGFRFIPGLPADAQAVLEGGARAAVLVVVLLAIGALFTAVNQIYERYPAAKTRPIKGYLQVGKIVVYALGGVVVIATLLGQSPFLYLSGIGAMTAVLLLVFKDTILSLVASVQLTANDMVRVGDWIEMPKYGADGDVVDIALHSVTIQNWDKTVVSVPTYALISDSFKNWRTMSESGGRRIKRSLLIDETTIRFLDDAEVERFRAFALLREYVAAKEAELRAFNERLGGNAVERVNARRLTNIGTFRAYVTNYLRHHPAIHQGMTLMVRQLAPSPQGVPLELYAFTNTTEWLAYEGIQSDIFDHIMAFVPEFGLRLYQYPTGQDRQEWAGPVTAG